MGDNLLSRWVTHFLVYLKRCRLDKERTSIVKYVLRNAKNVQKKSKAFCLKFGKNKKQKTKHGTLYLSGIIKTK